MVKVLSQATIDHHATANAFVMEPSGALVLYPSPIPSYEPPSAHPVAIYAPGMWVRAEVVDATSA